MTEEKTLVEEGNKLLLSEWKNFEQELINGIDEALKRGNTDPVTLRIMKELLGAGEVKVKKKTIEEYFEEQDKLNEK